MTGLVAMRVVRFANGAIDMLKHPSVTRERIKNTITRVIEPLLYEAREPLEVARYVVGGEPVGPDVALAADYESVEIGLTWGGAWDTTWFRFSGQVPAQWAGGRVVTLIDLGFAGWGEGFGVEGMIWRDGRPRGAVNLVRHDAPLIDSAIGGEDVLLHVEAASNPRTDTNYDAPLLLPDYDCPAWLTLKQAEIARVDVDAWALYHDFVLCADALNALPEDGPRHGQVMYALNAAVNALMPGDRSTIPAARQCLVDVMRRTNSETAHTVSAIGHAHIDTAWLWPLRETVRKCARTFSTAIEYMKEYPEYIFGCSQAQQYSWMKAHYPTIYEDIRAAIQRGQWEAIGSMWIEADCNVTSGESLVRQILHGKRFFKDEFGVDTIDLWIPDVFGYSAALPQIMAQSGIRYFLTQKISWNQFNSFPHHTFLWEGIDGTRILTHFPPADTYNGRFNPSEVMGAATRFRENDRATRSLYAYGYGDGGGGPTRGMLEFARRLKDFEGLPRVELEKVSDFFPKAEADAVDPPVWVGELYLELHRATLTTQARNKRGNRKGECLLRDAEFFDAVDCVLNGGADGDSITPQAPDRAVYDTHLRADAEARRGRVGALDRAWKLLLLNQFHDIIPGSSINWVYRDSDNDYATIHALGEQVRDDALAQLITAGDAVTVCNTLGHERREVIDGLKGAPIYVSVPSCGYAVVDSAATGLPDGMAPVGVTEGDGCIELDNGLLRVVINADGNLAEIHDRRADRQVLTPGEQGNLLQLHEDLPNAWDAWDVDLFYKEKVENVGGLTALDVLESGPLRVVVRVRRAFGQSTLEQTIVLQAGSPRLDFHTQVDWHERHRFLKAAFPVNVRSARATYEIQYGHAERPTHYNTSWDMARFEVCGQKWVDLSEAGYGVALLNDCKYGHDVYGGVMRLSLLRGPTAPDPVADEGAHRFSYALFPHAGSFQHAGVIEAAYDFNVPLVVRSGRPTQTADADSWFAVDRPGVVIEAVKIAEDGDSLIVRLYEAHGGRGPAVLRTSLPFASARDCNLLEEDGDAVEIRDGEIRMDLRPFEIRTLKFPLS